MAHHVCPRCNAPRNASKTFCENCARELVRARNKHVGSGKSTVDEFVDQFIAPYVTSEVADTFRRALRDNT